MGWEEGWGGGGVVGRGGGGIGIQFPLKLSTIIIKSI